MATKKKKPVKGKSKKAPVKKATAVKKSARKPNAGFMAPMQPSAELAEIIGSKAMPRTEATKKIWVYIKKRNLQDPKNRRNIVADEALSKIFNGKKVVTMFELTKLVSKHLSPS